ncbi:MAG TPA: hypothetical protein VGF60_05045 [Xanthobacteraceae bacterium]|jgi:hypothetical protein
MCSVLIRDRLQVTDRMMRIYVLSAWLGRVPSFGMLALVPPLRKYGQVSFHCWKEISAVVTDINRRSDKIVIIGYSFGANMLGWCEMAQHYGRPSLRRRVELGIAYDPSRGWPLGTNTAQGNYTQHVTMFDRLICYHHPRAWLVGGTKYSGPGVQNVEVNDLHLLIQFNILLHNRTVREVAKLAQSARDRELRGLAAAPTL